MTSTVPLLSRFLRTVIAIGAFGLVAMTVPPSAVAACPASSTTCVADPDTAMRTEALAAKAPVTKITLTRQALPRQAYVTTTTVTLKAQKLPATRILANATFVTLNKDRCVARGVAGSVTVRAKTVAGYRPSAVDRAIKFVAPRIRTLTAPTTYFISVSGSATNHQLFSSKNCATITLMPTPANGVQYAPGTDATVTTNAVDTTGGTIAVSAPGTPVDGATITVPPGAIGQATNFTVGYNTGTFTGSANSQGVITIAADTTSQFNQPVTITLPFADDGRTPVPYYVDETGTLHLAQILRIDHTAHTITFQTFHASLYTWLLANLPVTTSAYWTGYGPLADGFQIDNNGSVYNRGGECFGMTSFSLWYYSHKKSAAGAFYDKYMSVVGTDSDNNTLYAQNLIATRSFISIAQKWNTYLPLIATEQNLTDSEKLASIQNALMITGKPVLVYLYHDNTAGSGAHSILAYGFVNKDIFVYNPNNHGDGTQYIEFNTATNTFVPYGGYDGIVYNGDGSLNITEPYENIYQDANSNFNNSAKATIAVNTPANGSTVTERNSSISGTITSGQVLVEKLTVLVGSVPYTGTVNTSGYFSMPIELERGENHLTFQTQGRNSGGTLIDVPNDLQATDYVVTLDTPTTVLLMTLTWDTADTDLDTYVISPSGDYSAYYHRTMANGGTLDRDITSGYGPEHWTLLSTNTVEYDSPYTFRVHYYSDHTHGPTNYTVTIVQYEDTDRETSASYSGGLATSNPSNSSPSGTGPDWADIAQVTLTQSPTGATVPVVAFRTANGYQQVTLQPTVKRFVPSATQRAIVKSRAMK